jgi:hypothetical protein
MSRSKLKTRILKHNLLPYFCSICKISTWIEKKLSLHLDHIDGNSKNNDLSNLRFLCPNCHSQTDTYCGKNNSTKYSILNLKVTDEQVLAAINQSSNVAKALEILGLSGANNYYRVYRIADRHGILSHASPELKIQSKKQKLLESGINTLKWGWLNEAAVLLEMTPQASGRWIRRHMPEFILIKDKQLGTC